MKKGVTINFSLTNRWLYTLIAFLVLAIVGVGVYAFGTNNPSAFGHSSGEIEGLENLIPPGAIMFFDLISCPIGWTEATVARGRYLVGIPSSGTLGGIIGTALTNLQDKTHTHTSTAHTHPLSGAGGASIHGSFGVIYFKTSGLGPSFSYQDRTLASDSSGAGTKGSAPLVGNTDSATPGNTGANSGTDAPYIQYLVCKKD